MGCDIHTIAQVFQDGKWDTVADNIGDEDRQYHSFAVLAGVRNDGWPVISQPRGIPKDMNLEGADYYHYRILLPLNLEKWLGDHSHSWLLLSEMLEFLEKTIKPMVYSQKGVVDKVDYLAYKKDGTLPSSWCRSVGGGAVVVVVDKIKLKPLQITRMLT